MWRKIKFRANQLSKSPAWSSTLSGRNYIWQPLQGSLIISFWPRWQVTIRNPVVWRWSCRRMLRIFWARWTLPNFMGWEKRQWSVYTRWGSILVPICWIFRRWPWSIVLVALATISSVRPEVFTIALSKIIESGSLLEKSGPTASSFMQKMIF